MFSKRIGKQIQIIESENMWEMGPAWKRKLKLIVKHRKDAIRAKSLTKKISESFLHVLAYNDKCELHEWRYDYESEFYDYSDDLHEAYYERILARNCYRAGCKFRYLKRYFSLIYKSDVSYMQECCCGDLAILFNTKIDAEYKEYLYKTCWDEERNEKKIYLPIEVDFYMDHIFDKYLYKYENFDPNKDRLLSILASVNDNCDIYKIIAKENNAIEEDIKKENMSLEEWTDPFEDIDF